MKQALKYSALAAFSLVMASPPVYALGRCESLFANREQKRAAPIEARAKQRADEARSLQNWAESIRAGKPSVDLSFLQSVILGGMKESPGITRRGSLLKGQFKPVLEKETKTGPLFKPSGMGIVYGRRRYIEFPNSTILPVPMPDGTVRLWMFTRGVRPYKVVINRSNGETAPRGYVSDVLMFEIVGGKTVFHSLFLESAPETKFLFEDPRIVDPQMVNEAHRLMKVKLAGTDYSPHKDPKDNPKNNPDVMNRYIDLDVDVNGVPVKPHVDPVTKTPDFKDLSPKPIKKKNGKYLEIDAKNATVTTNSFGEVVVHTRLRPNFKDQDILAIFDGKPYAYALQAFGFKSEADFLNYQWADAIYDLTGKATPDNVMGSVRPVFANELVRDTQLPEHLKVPEARTDLEIIPGEKGIGNGTRMIRTRRAGDLLLTTDVNGAGEYITGVLSASERETYPVADGEEVPTRLDHEIRKIKQKTPGGTLKRRHYSMSFTVMNARQDRIVDYLPDILQPRFPHELGLDSGILDLLHLYPMGIAVIPKQWGDQMHAVTPETLEILARAKAEAGSGEPAKAMYESMLADVVARFGLTTIVATGGTSDANTDLYELDQKVLLARAKVFTDISGGPFRMPIRPYNYKREMKRRRDVLKSKT